MTEVTIEAVRKVAQLARLDLQEDQLETYTIQLEKILGYVAQLQEIDTQDIQPTTRAVEVVNVLRADLIESSSIREDLLDLAPHREENFFRVPKILSD
tara:strand:- start:218 stop:511 length:294 start_codon:yes stop_codon:yes gene_type:complete